MKYSFKKDFRDKECSSVIYHSPVQHEKGVLLSFFIESDVGSGKEKYINKNKENDVCMSEKQMEIRSMTLYGNNMATLND